MYTENVLFMKLFACTNIFQLKQAGLTS